MKKLTEQQVSDLIRLKFGGDVESAEHTSYVSNAILSKLFGVSREQVRQLYLARFD